MQVNVAGIRRNFKNLAHNYSDAQIKVREATSNDPWGPSATIMAEIADLTYNVVAFSEIMQMVWKRLNDHGKNWRHVYKSLILLEYLIKTGTEKVAQQCKENIFAIQTLREFQYLEEGKDQGLHVREKAKQLASLLKDDERLKNERTKALKAKERFAQHASGFGSDGSIDGPIHRDPPMFTGIDESRPPAPDIEFVRPQTAGEEELQLQLAMAMSREEAEQEEAKRRSDDVRLQLAISQSEQDFNKDGSIEITKKSQASHLLDLLDINLGAGASSGPEGWSLEPPANIIKESRDPWSTASSPPSDPWYPTRVNSISTPVGLGVSDNNWLPQTESPAASSSPSLAVLGWLQNTNPPNGNVSSSNWLIKPEQPIIDPWLSKPGVDDPWLSTSNTITPNQNFQSADPWAPNVSVDKQSSPVGVLATTISDLDDFDIITNRKQSADNSSPVNGANNNNASLLDDMDPMTQKLKQSSKTPHAFLGENSSLVNLDYLIKPNIAGSSSSTAYNPFNNEHTTGSTSIMPQRSNLFNQHQPVSSINQLKQTPFPVNLNQDPWAPINSTQNNNPNHNTPCMKPEAESNPFL